jgi:DNA-binding MarR family transcriptional regulator
LIRAVDQVVEVPSGQTSDDDTRQRIAAAWRELRRGASGAALRAHLVGPGGPAVEQSQLDALEVLARAPDGWRMSEFADAMHVDPSTATRAIDRLQRLGLAERSVATDDRRVVLARPTALGRRTVREMLVRRTIGMERVLEPFSAAERAQFADYLERLVASVERLVAELATEGEPGPRRAGRADTSAG